MEIKDISMEMITTLYQNYVDGNDILYAIEIYDDNNFWISLLKFIIKYDDLFPFKKIIKKSIINSSFLLSNFFVFILTDFIDFFNKLNYVFDKKFFETINNSYFLYILSIIIKNQNDNIKNYQTIISYAHSVDVYYDKYLGALFDDFIDYCIVFVKDHTIKEQLNYLFKVYDFFLKIKENKENDKFYNFIKPLFFEVKSEEIISPKLETYKYKNDKEIIK